jgi:hypothetical protein
MVRAVGSPVANVLAQQASRGPSLAWWQTILLFVVTPTASFGIITLIVIVFTRGDRN